jgi:hypothetical protein
MKDKQEKQMLKRSLEQVNNDNPVSPVESASTQTSTTSQAGRKKRRMFPNPIQREIGEIFDVIRKDKIDLYQICNRTNSIKNLHFIRDVLKAVTSADPYNEDINVDLPAVEYDIEQEVDFFNSLRKKIERSKKSHEKIIKVPSTNQEEESTYCSSMTAAQLFADISQKFGGLRNFYAFQAGKTLHSARNFDQERYIKEMKCKSQSVQQKFRRYLKFYTAIYKCPIFTLLDESMETIEGIVKRFEKFVENLTDDDDNMELVEFMFNEKLPIFKARQI